MNVNLAFLDEIFGTWDNSKSAIVQNFESLGAQITNGWLKEHNADNTHGTVTADSLTSRGAITVAGNATVAGTTVLTGATTAGTVTADRIKVGSAADPGTGNLSVSGIVYGASGFKFNNSAGGLVQSAYNKNTQVENWTFRAAGQDVLTLQSNTPGSSVGGALAWNIPNVTQDNSGVGRVSFTIGYNSASSLAGQLILTDGAGTPLVLTASGTELLVGGGQVPRLNVANTFTANNQYFGSGPGYIYFNSDELNFRYDANSSSAGYINNHGYNGGLTQFRDLLVQDGKGATIATFTGSTKVVRFNGYAAGTPTFVAGDKYLVVDANGNVHVSAVGPAS